MAKNATLDSVANIIAAYDSLDTAGRMGVVKHVIGLPEQWQFSWKAKGGGDHIVITRNPMDIPNPHFFGMAAHRGFREKMTDASANDSSLRRAKAESVWESLSKGNFDARAERGESAMHVTFDVWLASAADRAAKALFGKADTFKGKSGKVYRADKPADVATLAAQFRERDSWVAGQRLTYDASRARAEADINGIG